jgi:hypothetical protein
VLKILLCQALFQSAQDIFEKKKDPESDSDSQLWIRKAQKHAVPGPGPDPQHGLQDNTLV